MLALFGSAPITTQRVWLAALAIVVPGATATRWLLLVDAACLIALGLAVARPVIAIPTALAVGFAVVNALGMVLTDFYLGLAVFHFAVALTALIALRRRRWLGATSLALVLVVGVVT